MSSEQPGAGGVHTPIDPPGGDNRSLPWWAPLLGVVLVMAIAAIGSRWNGPVDPTKFGTAADWAVTFGTVLAVSLALWRYQEDRRVATLKTRDVQAKALAQSAMVAALPELRTALEELTECRGHTTNESVAGGVRILQQSITTTGLLTVPELSPIRDEASQHVSAADELLGRDWDGSDFGLAHQWLSDAESLAERMLDNVELLVTVYGSTAYNSS